MPWIESHTVLLRHRKLSELARSLRLKPVHCLGHLHVLWHAALEQQEDGDLSQWSDEFIAENAAYSGDAPQFVSLLQLHGWLDGKLLHDWLDYAGRYLIGRYSSKNRERLVEIWSKHRKVYGEQKASEVRVKGESYHSPPLVGLGNGLVSELGNGGLGEMGPPKVSDGVSLGALWVFHLSRRKNRVKADDPDDAQAVFDELIRVHGITEAALTSEIERKDRDRTEYLWQLKERILGAKKADVGSFQDALKQRIRDMRTK